MVNFFRRMLHSCSSSASNVATKLDMSEHTIEYTPVENVSQEINMEEDVNVEGVMIMEGEMNWNEAIDLDEDFDVDDTVYKDGDMIVDEETNMDVEIEANEEMNGTEVNVNHFNIDEEDANDDHIQLRAREGNLTSNVDYEVMPFVGMEFDSESKTDDFYMYTETGGFDTCLRDDKKNKHGIMYYKQWACNRRDFKKKRIDESTKCGCKTGTLIELDESTNKRAKLKIYF